VRQLLEGLERADDVFYDTVSQIDMDRWHQGRVALVGDSAFVPSFLSGQGTSIALIGAHVLASELVAEPGRAFAAYEARLRDFIGPNQAIAVRENTNALPRDRKALRKRNLKMWALPWLQRTGLLKLLDRGYRAIPTSFSTEGYGLT
jgi:2-polyprenyl-6-methoxyphenol hydroxylase-like FAD-dependent oxidoreductase